MRGFECARKGQANVNEIERTYGTHIWEHQRVLLNFLHDSFFFGDTRNVIATH